MVLLSPGFYRDFFISHKDKEKQRIKLASYFGP
jgi:hypothetical protein